MTKHDNIHKPDEFSEQDYKAFEKKLFSASTPRSELERICMTLAHVPTKRAQDLLTLFKESDRAHEVPWLDVAAEEGRYDFLDPQNEQEERDFLALKVMQEMWDEMIELEMKEKEAQLAADKMDIQYEAVKELVKKGKLDSTEEVALQELKRLSESRADELSREIERKDKIFDQIKESIKTEKYKDVDVEEMRDIHFDGFDG